MYTKRDIEYRSAPYPGVIAVIPAGTEVEPADNLPGEAYWACEWEGMDDKAESWQRNYGFLIDPDDVINGE